MNARLAPAGDSEAAAARIATLEARIAQLETINSALIDRVERSSDFQGGAFSMFETAISLEALVRERTAALEDALARLSRANAALGHAHREAEEARTRLRDAIETLADGFALFDAQDRLILCNAAYRRYWPEVGELAADPPFTDVINAVARSGRTVGALVSPERWVADRLARHATADGVHVQALSDGRWLQINEIRTSEGGTVGIYTDITEVKAEDARDRARELAERNLALQATLDTLSEGVCLYDQQHGLVVHNGGLARILRLPPGDRSAIATHAGLVAHCRSLGLADADILDWRAAEGERRAAQGRLGERLVEIRSTPIQPGGMAFSFDDITDRLHYEEGLREAAETLERRVAARTIELEAEVAERRTVEAALLAAKTAAELANRSKTSFLAAASHDLLQPLNAARLFVAALGERRLALPTRALVRQTGTALDSVEELLEALFEISRLDAGAMQPEIGPIELDRMLGALRIEFATQARQSGLVLKVPETGIWVRSDVRLLRRILQNFVSNALRYTRMGSVAITVTCVDGLARIAVRDTGPGIDPANFELIFEEFRRLSHDRGPTGKGLGLAIVRRASQMLGHRVELASRPGEGAEFAVLVPLGEASPAEPQAARPRERSSGETTGGRVLIVDNDEAILQGMEALLGKWGYRVLTAHSLDAALELPELKIAGADGLPALLIADYHLDDGERGDAVVAALRRQFGAQVPALIISADRSEEVKAQLAAAGLPMLHKPVKPAQLRALLRTLVN
ncbi:NahK/ErcS family hybrid sensor histidine kinase/response regulator [Novosphingobium sp. FKTRR1]|uniref:hybrid sensor histidine kinase/response regulator n=1 Tax=Novosphingobium sp. FKTRR1 TaxID=2879118 RepID=UPI001CEFFF2E|nr:NahK/ErcS family hybrid sensor histidine kinase/response regulator [Novosphingobium sp. FKTRR1]